MSDRRIRRSSWLGPHFHYKGQAAVDRRLTASSLVGASTMAISFQLILSGQRSVKFLAGNLQDISSGTYTKLILIIFTLWSTVILYSSIAGIQHIASSCVSHIARKYLRYHEYRCRSSWWDWEQRTWACGSHLGVYGVGNRNGLSKGFYQSQNHQRTGSWRFHHHFVLGKHLRIWMTWKLH